MCLNSKKDLKETLNTMIDEMVKTEETNTSVTNFSDAEKLDYLSLSGNFSLWELELALDSADCGSAAGPDGVSNKDLKSLSLKGKSALLKEINHIFQAGSFPKEWKVGEGIPIQKPGKDKYDINSYRVIVKTSHIGKLYERLILRRLMNILEENHVLKDEMSAYRPLRSAQDNILDICSDIEEAKANKGHVLAVFFDIEGAYNSLSHFSVLHTLRRIGIPQDSRLYNVIAEYLRGRTIYLKCDKTQSKTVELGNKGVPQGGVLSPTLFVMTISSICNNLSKGFRLSQYSDDGALWIRLNGQTVNPIASLLMQRMINVIAKDLECMGLKIEPSKTKAMVFNSKKGQKIRISLGDRFIQYVNQTRFLGVSLQSDNKWTVTLDDLRARCEKVLNLLRNACGVSWGVSPTVAIHLVRALLCSKIDYALEFMSSLSVREINVIDSIVARCGRMGLGLLSMTATHSVLNECGIMPAEIRREFLLKCHINRLVRSKHSLIQTILSERPNSAAAIAIKQLPLLEEGLLVPDLAVVDVTGIEMTVVTTIPGISKKTNHDANTLKVLTEQHLWNLVKEGNVVYCTDGSRGDNDTGGAGLCCVNTKWEGNVGITNCESSTTAELVAIHEVLLQEAANRDNHCIVILCDSKAALNSIQAVDPASPNANMIQAIVNCCRVLKKAIIFQWVPSHVGISGNEKADILARKGCVSKQVRRIIPKSISYSMGQLKKDTYQIWREKSKAARIQTKRSSMGVEVCTGGPLRLLGSRRTAVIAHRLRCGKALTNSTLFQIGVRQDATCETCNEYDDVIHVLDKCRKFKSQREIWIRQTSTPEEELPVLNKRLRPELTKYLMEYIKNCKLDI